MIITINFKQISERVSVRDYVEYLGIDIDSSGKILCPFHNDKHASMKVDKRFHCFGCGEDGDVINFASKYFDISSSDAALKICYVFGIELYGNDKEPGNYKKLNNESSVNYRELKQLNLKYLINLEKELKSWIEDYKPKSENEHLHFLFVTAIHKIEYVSYLIDTLFKLKTDEKVKEFIKNYMKEGII